MPATVPLRAPLPQPKTNLTRQQPFDIWKLCVRYATVPFTEGDADGGVRQCCWRQSCSGCLERIKARRADALWHGMAKVNLKHWYTLVIPATPRDWNRVRQEIQRTGLAIRHYWGLVDRDAGTRLVLTTVPITGAALRSEKDAYQQCVDALKAVAKLTGRAVCTSRGWMAPARPAIKQVNARVYGRRVNIAWDVFLANINREALRTPGFVSCGEKVVEPVKYRLDREVFWIPPKGILTADRERMKDRICGLTIFWAFAPPGHPDPLAIIRIDTSLKAAVGGTPTAPPPKPTRQQLNLFDADDGAGPYRLNGDGAGPSPDPSGDP